MRYVTPSRQKKVKPKVTVTKRGDLRSAGAQVNMPKGVFTIKKTITKKKYARNPKL